VVEAFLVAAREGDLDCHGFLAARPCSATGARERRACWAALLDGAVYSVGAPTPHNARITTINILADASRLAHLDLRALDSQSP
jgi:hypothetical protein